MKAYNVSFTNAPSGPGRHSRHVYRSAVVIADTVSEAGDLADAYCRKHWPKLHLEEIRLDDDTVIMS